MQFHMAGIMHQSSKTLEDIKAAEAAIAQLSGRGLTNFGKYRLPKRSTPEVTNTANVNDRDPGSVKCLSKSDIQLIVSIRYLFAPNALLCGKMQVRMSSFDDAEIYLSD